MQDTDAQTKPRRGRPATGRAKSSTERNRARRAALAASGCRLLGSVVLTPEAAAALDALTDGGATIDAAVCEALTRAAAARG